IELGVKGSRNVFLGGYLGLGFGDVAGGHQRQNCEQKGGPWRARGVVSGLQLHGRPAASTNPWFGVGIGYESMAINMSAQGQSGTVSVSGLEFPRVMAGLDFRVTSIFGLGPFIDLSVGQFSNVHAS